MNRIAKGAVASGAAAVLLLGGGGSLAYWTASDSVAGGSFNTGSLGLTANDCSSAAWTYATPGSVGQTVNLIVPGDTIQKDCTFVVEATGDHLEARVTAPADVPVTGPPEAETLEATVAATYLIGTTPIADGETITSANDGQTLTAHFEVTFPFGNETTINADDTQEILATLASLTVTLEQVDPAA